MTRELPILFSAPMVRAILDGRKTQTRRVLKPQPEVRYIAGWGIGREGKPNEWTGIRSDRGNTPGLDDWERWRKNCAPARWQPGDHLWVRETWRTLQKWDDDSPRQIMNDIDKVDYAADGFPRNPLWAWGKTRPSLHMPRWASRITLRVTDVRVERVQDISEADAIAEGVTAPAWGARDAFRGLWDSLYAKRGHGWDANPWVSVTTFERVTE